MTILASQRCYRQNVEERISEEIFKAINRARLHRQHLLTILLEPADEAGASRVLSSRWQSQRLRVQSHWSAKAASLSTPPRCAQLIEHSTDDVVRLGSQVCYRQLFPVIIQRTKGDTNLQLPERKIRWNGIGRAQSWNDRQNNWRAGKSRRIIKTRFSPFWWFLFSDLITKYSVKEFG